MALKRKAVFLDKDGTIVKNVPYNVNVRSIEYVEQAFEALRKLQDAGFLLLIVTNQAGVAHGFFPESALALLHERLNKDFQRNGVVLNGFYYCPHHPDGSVQPFSVECECRKPKPGMLFNAAEDFSIELSQSFLVGDILNDIEAGNTAGCRSVLIDAGNETEWNFSPRRKPIATVSTLMEAAEVIVSAKMRQKEGYESRNFVNFG